MRAKWQLPGARSLKSGLGSVEDFPLCAQLRRWDLLSRHLLPLSLAKGFLPPPKIEIKRGGKRDSKEGLLKNKVEEAWCIKGDTLMKNDSQNPAGSGLHKAGFFTQVQDGFHSFLGSHQEWIPSCTGAEWSSLLSRNPVLSPSGVKQHLGTAELSAFEGRCQPMQV